MPAAVKASGAAIAAMSGAADANPGLLPVGLGELGGKFSQVYSDTFERIILAGQDVRAVLDDQANALKVDHGGSRRSLLGARSGLRWALPGRVDQKSTKPR